MEENSNQKDKTVEELLDTLLEPDTSYKFPYDNYKIIGEINEINKIINSFGIINIDVIDITSTLSAVKPNYIAVGTASGKDRIANAISDAIDKLPINLRNVSKILLLIWIPGDIAGIDTDVISPLTAFTKSLHIDIDIVRGCGFDKSMNGQQAKVTLIAASKQINQNLRSPT